MPATISAWRTIEAYNVRRFRSNSHAATTSPGGGRDFHRRAGFALWLFSVSLAVMPTTHDPPMTLGYMCEAGIIRFAASFITALALNASVAETAPAQSRPDTTRMSCAAARALVMRHGAIVLGTGRSRFDPNAPPLFDRYVNSQAYCMRDEVTEPAFVPTADNLQCFIGYTCRQPRYYIH